ncbi:hypothetical protein QOZ88_08330 [Blastococcus sp. BMG 814]|uniref:Uncharacterized protein n=1 Tax=Blastococcus carthaginiensis TaxID=3050034 RepID=A0ABT9IAQ3_9ACTN|nr:hypothetical protein [Blastococcus carthaginiensis]MDP5182645.1 hypothetical protein [Blastococcus carthaginiensis]
MENRQARRHVRLMTDYGAAWPLWTVGPTHPATLGLSEALTARLTTWNQLFQEHFHWDDGWRDPDARARFAAEGPRLLRDLRRELPDDEVELDDWTQSGAPGQG